MKRRNWGLWAAMAVGYAKLPTSFLPDEDQGIVLSVAGVLLVLYGMGSIGQAWW